MTGSTKVRISAEGADPLALAGVGEANLIEVAEATGTQITLRGDELILSGEPDGMETAIRILETMVNIARSGEDLTVGYVRGLISEVGNTESHAANGELKIVLPSSRRAVQPRTEGQREYLRAIRDNEIVIGIGPAGTGKTFLAVAAGAEALVRRRVKRLVLARPAVEAGERLGFLPGDLRDKVDPYLRPLYDALEDLMPYEKVQRYMETRAIEIAPLAYMRGRTLQDAFVILDEAQNVTSGQMKMFLTRLGVNSRAVVIGDKTQIDLDRRETSGLLEVEQILSNIDGVRVSYLDGADVVRHRLVREIISAYDSHEERSQEKAAREIQ